jgi:hypothetical protein
MLQIADRLADGGCRKAEHASSSGKAAEIRSANKGRQAAQTIHARIPFESFIPVYMEN